MKGEELKVWRESQGKSQKDLAEELDVSRHSIIKWEQETDVPKLVELAICALDHASPMRLLAGRASSPEEISQARKLLDEAVARGKVQEG